MPENLFFLAVIPPEPLRDDLQDLKAEMARKFKSSHALKSPPHITLMPPFWFDKERLPEMERAVKEVSRPYLPLYIELVGFGAFRPRVIYVHVEDPTGALHSLQKSLKQLFVEKFDLRPDKRDRYRPHCTIGFKDLTTKMFYRAWDFYRDRQFSGDFTALKVAMLRHAEGKWVEI